MEQDRWALAPLEEDGDPVDAEWDAAGAWARAPETASGGAPGLTPA